MNNPSTGGFRLTAYFVIGVGFIAFHDAVLAFSFWTKPITADWLLPSVAGVLIALLLLTPVTYHSSSRALVAICVALLHLAVAFSTGQGECYSMMWVFALVLWIPSALVGRDLRRDRRENPDLYRPPTGICHSCGYDLTGNQSGICPECGTPVFPPPDTTGKSCDNPP